MSTEAPARCILQDQILTPCAGLEGVLEDHHKKGISLLPIHGGPEKNFRLTRTILMIKNGDYRRNGLVCKYCPFCGEVVYREPEAK